VRMLHDMAGITNRADPFVRAAKEENIFHREGAKAPCKTSPMEFVGKSSTQITNVADLKSGDEIEEFFDRIYKIDKIFKRSASSFENLFNLVNSVKHSALQICVICVICVKLSSAPPSKNPPPRKMIA
jgi:hypothetical protein